MEFLARLRQLTRHQAFNRLLRVRIAAQTGDGTVQVGMASYVLFSPQNAPNAVAIATVLAITLLPFSVIGPFVSVLLDRFPRQRIAMFTDITRAVICLIIAGLIWTNNASSGWGYVALFTLLLIAISLNRFMLAGLAAGLANTVNEDEYLSASSIMPMIGPLGLMLGGGIAGGTRLILGSVMTTDQANAVIFAIAAGIFVLSAAFASRIPKNGLESIRVWVDAPKGSSVVADQALAIPVVESGQQPLGAEQTKAYRATDPSNAVDVWRGLVEAFVYLRTKKTVMLGLTSVSVQRTTYGLLMVTTILAYRNYFHGSDDLPAAIVDLGLWFGITGAGYVLSGVFAPIVSNKFGVRGAIVLFLFGSAVVQLVPGSIFTRPTLVAAGFLLGLFAQSMKVCVDTVVQAHVDDEFKGRTFVLYDIMFNATLVFGATIGAFIVPEHGLSLPIYLGMSVAFFLVASWFTLRSRSLSSEFNAGTNIPH